MLARLGSGYRLGRGLDAVDYVLVSREELLAEHRVVGEAEDVLGALEPSEGRARLVRVGVRVRVGAVRARARARVRAVRVRVRRRLGLG